MKASFYDLGRAKVKVFILVHAMKLCVGMMYKLHTFLALAQDGAVSGQCQTLGSYPL